MLCPKVKCKGPLKVLRKMSYEAMNERIVQCSVCGYRFKTHELVPNGIVYTTRLLNATEKTDIGANLRIVLQNKLEL